MKEAEKNIKLLFNEYQHHVHSGLSPLVRIFSRLIDTQFKTTIVADLLFENYEFLYDPELHDRMMEISNSKNLFYFINHFYYNEYVQQNMKDFLNNSVFLIPYVKMIPVINKQLNRNYYEK